MRVREAAGFLRRALSAVGSVLKRGILGKAGHDHMKQFTGDDEYWDRVIAAQLGWPGEGTRGSDSDPSTSSGITATGGKPSLRDAARNHTEPEYEFVYGWTQRQFDDYMARNPGSRSAYESEVKLARTRPAGVT